MQIVTLGKQYLVSQRDTIRDNTTGNLFFICLLLGELSKRDTVRGGQLKT